MGRLLHPIRILHLLHRWLGIALGVVVLLWFLSGLVMLFVAYPHLDEEQRLHPLPRIPAGELQVTPLAAWQSLGRTDWPEAVRLDAEPGFAVYRFLAERRWWAVDAKNSRRIEPLDAGQAAAHVLALRGGAVQQVVPIERDQWTVSRRYEAWRPLYRVELADGRDVYVSRNGGDVVLETTFAERSWNWLGSVLHWVYFTPLREEATLWRQLVLWLSALAFIPALSGLWLGVDRLRLRPKKRYRGGRLTPYREWTKRWHHLLGLGAGVFIVTWLVSGWLSLSPFGWGSGVNTQEMRRQLAGKSFDADSLAARPSLPAGTRTVEWLHLGGSSWLRLRGDFNGEGRATDSRLQHRDTGLQAAFGKEELLKASATVLPSFARSAEWLTEADEEYYPLRHIPRRFPVLRLSFADPEATRLYLDPSNGQIVQAADRHGLTRRWLYHGLHRFDFPPLLVWPALRDGVVILLSLAAGGVVLLGVLLGWRRMTKTDKNWHTAPLNLRE
ncbi:MAG: PepSY domain-containing protein [Sterolibacterium sp.]|nr:PepSY domain-containing protein [Sterolibacterium sp.]MBP9800328.1 PepSY domain-containing protein [Sterolibacterium sp.]